MIAHPTPSPPPRADIDSYTTTRFGRLLDAVRAIERGDVDVARADLAGFDDLRVHESGDDLKCFLFLRSLWNRLNERLHHPGNLYLKEFAFRQIDLFNLMAERMPVIRKAAEAANHLLLCELLRREDAVLVDIGIGTGRQEEELLRLIARVEPQWDRLRIVGIDPSRASLKAAAQGLARVGAESGIDVEFTAICGSIETLGKDQWASLARIGRGAVFNEAFAMHHVAHRPGDYDLKDGVLRRLGDLEPSLLLLTEPDSDHESQSLAVRFRNAWRHFGLVFDVIDRIDATREERDAIKVLFFAREIEDIIAGTESERSERHESAAMWIRRLRRAGFHMRNELSACEERAVDGVRYAWKGDRLGIDFRGQTIVSLIAAGP